jgi:hypothetical protein
MKVNLLHPHQQYIEQVENPGSGRTLPLILHVIEKIPNKRFSVLLFFITGEGRDRSRGLYLIIQ